MGDAEHAQAAMNAAFASLNVSLAQNGKASNAIIAAMTQMMTGKNDEALDNIHAALKALRDARASNELMMNYVEEALR